MTKKAIKTLCFLFAILCLTEVPAFGQEQEDPSGRADLPGRSRLQIINGSNSTTVTFSVKNGNGAWSNSSLDPRKDRLFSNTTHIRIITKDNGKTVQYKLEYGKRYEIFWNAAEERWDVVRLVQKQP
ncbi:MAG: hypothetical protein ACREBG_19725 [Pyrinomonadaceae bacterium]